MHQIAGIEWRLAELTASWQLGSWHSARRLAADGWVGVGHGDASGEGVAVLCCGLVGLRLSCAKGGGYPIARKQEKAVKRAETNA